MFVQLVGETGTPAAGDVPRNTQVATTSQVTAHVDGEGREQCSVEAPGYQKIPQSGKHRRRSSDDHWMALTVVVVGSCT